MSADGDITTDGDIIVLHTGAAGRVRVQKSDIRRYILYRPTMLYATRCHFLCTDVGLVCDSGTVFKWIDLVAASSQSLQD